MSDTWTIGQGDLLPPFHATLTDKNGNPVDLTGCTATLEWKVGSSSFSRELEVVDDPGDGVVEYYPVEADTAVAGKFRAEVVVTDGDGKPRTYPLNPKITIEVVGSVVP